MGSIPEPLAARFELLRDLKAAYDLLDGLPSTGAEAERKFLQDKISDIEKNLAAGEAEALDLIEAVHGDSRTWLAASFRYRQGFLWGDVAELIGISEDAVKQRVYRAFRRVTREENNT